MINSKKVSKTLDEIITAIDKNKFRRGDDFIRKSVSADLSWMHDPALYPEANDDAQANKDPYSMELLTIQSFLDEINRGRTKDKKEYQKN